ncbi:Kelch-like protein 5 [Temnothorax longispinosus]|uniref:Kelch-like protein 5 n=1 Tax=Temnothorax longispinosus TaxID=300112 RepID=A0A4S2KMJ9_9HYME|nr:Kelch-like protein 5 [Temnothorax longispinosus]
MFKDQRMAQELVIEAFKYHLLPERRSLLQTGRTKPRKATMGTLLAVGRMDYKYEVFSSEIICDVLSRCTICRCIFITR